MFNGRKENTNNKHVYLNDQGSDMIVSNPVCPPMMIMKSKIWGYYTINAIFATFRFNIQAFPGRGKRFFALKMSNSDSPYVFTPREGHFQKKIFENFFT